MLRRFIEEPTDLLVMRITPNLAIVGSGQFALSGPYDCHVYAVRAPAGVVLIDTGSGLSELDIANHISEDFPGSPVVGAFVTHCHIDHSGGASGLKSRFGCPIFTSELTAPIVLHADEEAAGLTLARKRGNYPVDLYMKPYSPDHIFRDGDTVAVGGQNFLTLHIRGHSADSFCLVTTLDGKVACFSADVVFYSGILGVINAHDSSMYEYIVDLGKLAGLNIELLLPGHGLFTLINGQRHIDAAIKASGHAFLPMQIGQGVMIF